MIAAKTPPAVTEGVKQIAGTIAANSISNCAQCDVGAAGLTKGERSQWMLIFGQLPACSTCPHGDHSLAQRRLAWLNLQDLLHGDRLLVGDRAVEPMPGDDPDFWPGHQRRLERERRNQHFAQSPGLSPIERIKAGNRVEDVAMRLTRLHGPGNVLKGKCPLHNEQKGEAFTVWIDSQHWRCFGACGEGGDVVDLLRAARERGLSWTPS